MSNKKVNANGAGDNSPAPLGEEPQYLQIVDICSDIEFFCNEQKETFAIVPVKGHDELYPIKSKSFEYWVSYMFYQNYGIAFNDENLKKALGLFAAKANFDGIERKISKRIAKVGSKIYYDLNNENKHIVLITPDDWRIIKATKNAFFYRNKSMLSQVSPVKCEVNLEIILKYYRFKHEDDKILHFVSLVTRFIPDYKVGLCCGRSGWNRRGTIF